MRRDMKKIVLHAGRTSSPCGYRPTLHVIDGEVVAPPRESMKKSYRHYWRSKEMRLALRPLRRFVESQVGRNWDAVYSEICKNITGPHASRLLEYVSDWVAVKTTMLEGAVVVNTDFRGVIDVAHEADLYVHPETRILMAVDHSGARADRRAYKERRAAEMLAERRDISADRQLRCIGGIWYEIRLEELPWVRATAVNATKALDNETPWFQRPSVFDVVLGRRVFEGGFAENKLPETYGRRNVYGAHKRQLSGKEMRQLALAA